MAHGQTKATTRNLYLSKEQRILHCFALNIELQRILNDEPTEEEKKQHEILRAARDEQKQLMTNVSLQLSYQIAQKL